MMDATIHPVPGVRLGVAAAGIRYQGRDDLVLMTLPADATVSAVFTRNAFCAAPVTVAREHLAQAAPRGLLINAGNANAGTGAPGRQAADRCCELAAAACGCEQEQILPFSTGVIGEDLPTAPFAAAMPALVADLAEDNWPRAARAIMTTDTVAKLASRRLDIDGVAVTVTGMSKGSGMIHPDMATMLAFVATDVAISADLLQSCLQAAVADSFNAITVDGDTSTNDACVLMASGASGVTIESADSTAGQALFAAVADVCAELARAIVDDGEGATKRVTVAVSGAASATEARQVADTVALSPLVKTALFAADPNWGRILAAVGRAGVEELDVERVRIWLDQVLIVSGGGRDPGYTEAAGQAVMDQHAFSIRIDLGRGEASSRLLTCDLSYDYIKINAEYRS